MDLRDAVFDNLELMEEVFDLYQKDPQLVAPSWRHAFEALGRQQSSFEKAAPVGGAPPARHPSQGDRRIEDLIEAYRRYGHLMSQINPLLPPPEMPWQLQLENFGLSENDMQRSFLSHGFLKAESAGLADIIGALQRIYCGTISVEYIDLGNPEMVRWIQQQIEPNGFEAGLSIQQKKMILEDLNRSELFEMFLHTRYTGQKRFSIEGAETLIPMLDAVVDRGAELDIVEFVIGMAHRGRLNVLSNILRKSYAEIFSEFDENYVPSADQTGDVKYHKGFVSENLSSHGHKIRISITPNPSHLEAVDPVVEGQVYAKQRSLGEGGKKKVLPLLIHGDASLSGQGIVYETMQMQGLEGYSTGGTLHLVVNNQIGFTTVPKDSRSTLYCTDIARAFNAPVFHMNADDPEGCVFATRMAVELRQRFGCDVFLDLVCYRKYGHNETDEPAFTQPHEYQIINKKQSIREIYREHLVSQGLMEKNIAESLETEFKKSLQDELAGVQESGKKSLNADLPDVSPEKFLFNRIQTGVPLGILQEIATKACSIPEGFTIHPKLERIIKERLSMVKGTEPLKPIDWGMAETLAYGSLLWDGVHVRLSGQDCCRGTFSHRHAMWMDQQRELPYYPLKHLKPGQGQFEVYNSHLSEFGVLGFEFGYSLANPAALVLWEAQFGDFCNGAQVIIDQFISTGEQKWGQKFGLVLLLPHGYEGQGPEHSSGRMERFLTLAGQRNMCIANPSTPAQLFHLLRRQQMQAFKKPLIIFTPKALLRHQECISTLQDLTMGSFQEILDDPTPPEQVRRLALCSGHVYYDLKAERFKGGGEDLAIARVEQLYPFDRESMESLLKKYRSLEQVYWVQEEPSNMGPGQFICLELQALLPKEMVFTYIARPRSASPAAGSYALHKKQLKDLLGTLYGQRKPSIFDIAAKGGKIK